MAHSWDAPVKFAREQLLETLEPHIPDPLTREAVLDLMLEEIDLQLGDPDDEMIVAGQEVLDAAGQAWQASLFYRRRLIEQIWAVMVERAFGR